MKLDLLRSRHVLLRMFLGYFLSSPSPPLSFPANGPLNGSKTGHFGFFSRQVWGGRLIWVALRCSGASAAHNFRLVRPIASLFFSLVAMNLLSILLLGNYTTQH